jgi:hypothetical protein
MRCSVSIMRNLKQRGPHGRLGRLSGRLFGDVNTRSSRSVVACGLQLVCSSIHHRRIHVYSITRVPPLEMPRAGINICRHGLKHISPRSLTRGTFLRFFSETTRSSNAFRSLDLDSFEWDPPPPNPHAREIAVLGGGLTGLATAYYLRRELPNAKVTIYEKGASLGGWVNSEVVEVEDGEVLFEWGPRTVRQSSGTGLVQNMV